MIQSIQLTCNLMNENEVGASYIYITITYSQEGLGALVEYVLLHE